MASKVNGIISKISPESTAYALASSAYGYCETAAATANKVVDMTGFALVEGISIHVKFKYANTAASPKLNVNSTGNISIMQFGTTAATNWSADAIICFTYDGTNWLMNQSSASNVWENW